MSPDRLRRLIEAYGAEPGRWPAAEREPAHRLLARSPDAQALLAEARGLDRALDRYGVAPVRPDLAAVITRTARDLPQRLSLAGLLRLLLPPPYRWASAAAFATVIVAGFVLGLETSDVAPIGDVAFSVFDDGGLLL